MEKKIRRCDSLIISKRFNLNKLPVGTIQRKMKMKPSFLPEDQVKLLQFPQSIRLNCQTKEFYKYFYQDKTFLTFLHLIYRVNQNSVSSYSGLDIWTILIIMNLVWMRCSNQIWSCQDSEANQLVRSKDTLVVIQILN